MCVCMLITHPDIASQTIPWTGLRTIRFLPVGHFADPQSQNSSSSADVSLLGAVRCITVDGCQMPDTGHSSPGPGEGPLWWLPPQCFLASTECSLGTDAD